MSKKQNTSHLMMVRPDHFGFNEETAESNTFQSKGADYDEEKVGALAIQEFDLFVKRLRTAGVHVHIAKDAEDKENTDAVFPNNWISMHADGSVITYPMCNEKRRFERREEVIENLGKIFQIESRYTFEHYEAENKFLEGTGSMVLDRVHNIVYACLSPRTSIELLDKFCVLKGYTGIHFTAKYDDVDIYHTNVLMALGDGCVVICMDAIPEEEDRKKLRASFERTNKEVIEISLNQMNSFAGNMLEVEDAFGNKLMVMSQQAFDSLKDQQIKSIEKYAKIISSPIPTIEKYGGGSARCMMAEIFLLPKE